MPTRYFVVPESQLTSDLIQGLSSDSQLASGKQETVVGVPSSDRTAQASTTRLSPVGSRRGLARGRYKTFLERVEDLKHFKMIHGHINVKIPDDKSLSQFCANARYARKNPGKGMQLTDERIAALDAIDFDWESQEYVTKSFEERIEDLKKYKEKHGHINVKIAEDQSLGQFCANVRYAHRRPEKDGTRKLTAERIASLTAIGFDW